MAIQRYSENRAHRAIADRVGSTPAARELTYEAKVGAFDPDPIFLAR